MRGGLGDMMKQVQQMQAKMAALQEELENTELEASSGGGMVKVVMNGKNVVRSITIDREVVDPEDVEMLQDLIVAAVNQAREKVQELQAQQMAQITGGLNLPGLGGLPF
ncbi:MAG TPA: YbaB/EbfC family nucleoid-associated protein [candidate division Zixibacteria bacterium]|nr:YbaB/EbfC family nucleoid-associated protein [candidate division Zixibacteria bacterium]MDD4917013.1 YbaB/EbfC family nucleoid-associated protein [candidate division Zixibacteria bacterium]MDM7971421.1 YbaB/EbfC family nucleoid-associated protein [candidate division Zixibacteria bacterium]HOD66154.1 YbaB/EbfC family nucleoid-associated protein [candidate division Zixibacteria bacterium]HPC10836.1 YbaB/EbfC family nucleoid-associated protein [candidate division Zixibacteria bacterium]